MLGKITPQKTSVVLPASSPLIKLAIRPKKIPMGETNDIKSKNIYGNATAEEVAELKQDILILYRAYLFGKLH